MRTEAVAVIYWGMAGKVLLDHLRGTPFLPWMMRLFGSKFGKGVYMDMTDITEFDCIKVGDFAALNALSALQTHLYEDRVMKVGRVFVGDGVTIGAGSTVLYDTFVSDYARLGPLTLVDEGRADRRALRVGRRARRAKSGGRGHHRESRGLNGRYALRAAAAASARFAGRPASSAPASARQAQEERGRADAEKSHQDEGEAETRLRENAGVRGRAASIPAARRRRPRCRD